MNIASHIAVADLALDGRLTATARAGHLLGSALPDLAGMARFRLLGSTDDGPVDDGIAVHHRTDDLFHRHPWFSTRNRTIHDELRGAGLARGPAMACGHVGIELLLDGAILSDDHVAGACGAALAAIEPRRDALGDLVTEPGRHADWQHHLSRLAAWRLPDDYDDPWAVAARLERILARRPRLALPPNRIPLVAETLAAHQPGIAATARDLITELAAELAPPPIGRAGQS